MESFQKYFEPRTLARLEGLELRARSIVEGYVAGQHRSPFHGYSVEFAEHREYVPGDDLRYVDWKVFGKSDRIYVKQFEEETNFACYVLLDTSESMLYRSDKVALTKLDYAKCVAASLAWLVLQQHDAIGVATFDRELKHFVRASSHPAHWKTLCQVMDHSPALGETGIGPILHDMAERIHKRGVVLVLSDLFDDPESIALGLKHLRHRRHDVRVLQVIDPMEQDFTFTDPTLFRGLEGLAPQPADPRALRAAYQHEFARFVQTLRGTCRDLHITHHLIRTDERFDITLRRVLQGHNG